MTPFGIIDSREDAPADPDVPSLGGGIMRHADWHEDAFIPNFIPPVGSRIFTNHTEQSARDAHERRMKIIAEKFPDHPLPDADVEKEIIADILRSPRIQVVDEALHAEFRRLAQDDPWRPNGMDRERSK